MPLIWRACLGDLMKFARFTDLPILVKMGLAPACAAVMVAVSAAAMFSIEAHQSTELRRVVQTDLPVSLLGQSALRRLGSVTLKGDRLIIAG